MSNISQLSGAELIAVERQRQVDAEGWTPEHDREHNAAELNKAARVYAIAAQRQALPDQLRLSEEEARTYGWPSDWDFNPSDDPVRNLVKAGALIAAEIDRITS